MERNGSPEVRTDYHATVIAGLEDAGRTLMMLSPPARGRPAPPRSAWPEYGQTFWDVFGHADEDETEDRREILASQINFVRIHASQKAVDRLDEVLGWLWYIKVPRERRAVFARMLTHPVGDRPVHSWAKIARNMGADRRTVKNWYTSGVDAIVVGLARP